MTDRNAIHQELTSLLEKLALQTEHILGTEHPSDLDIDIARQYLRELYDSFGGLRHTAPAAVPEMTPVKEEIVEAPAVVEEAEPQPVAVEAETEEELELESENENEFPGGGERPSLAEIFRPDQADRSVGAKLSRSRIPDLRKAIGINEKFIFSKELFSGNINSYEEAVNKLNEAEGLDAAFGILETYRSTENWQDDSEALKMLVEFIERRHA